MPYKDPKIEKVYKDLKKRSKGLDKKGEGAYVYGTLNKIAKAKANKEKTTKEKVLEHAGKKGKKDAKKRTKQKKC